MVSEPCQAPRHACCAADPARIPHGQPASSGPRIVLRPSSSYLISNPSSLGPVRAGVHETKDDQLRAGMVEKEGGRGGTLTKEVKNVRCGSYTFAIRTWTCSEKMAADPFEMGTDLSSSRVQGHGSSRGPCLCFWTLFCFWALRRSLKEEGFVSVGQEFSPLPVGAR